MQVAYARGGRIAAGGGLFAGGPFAGGLIAGGLIAGGLFASGLNAAHPAYVCYRQTNMSEERKSELLTIQQDHLNHAQGVRKYMLECIKAAKEAIGLAQLGQHAPLSGPDVSHYSLDYAQQVC